MVNRLVLTVDQPSKSPGVIECVKRHVNVRYSGASNRRIDQEGFVRRFGRPDAECSNVTDEAQLRVGQDARNARAIDAAAQRQTDPDIRWRVTFYRRDELRKYIGRRDICSG